MAKSKKDQSSDNTPAEEADAKEGAPETIAAETPDTIGAEDTVAGEDSLAADDTVTGEDTVVGEASEDTVVADVEGDTIVAASEDTSEFVAEDADAAKTEPDEAEGAETVSLEDDASDVAASEADDTLAGDDTLVADVAEPAPAPAPQVIERVERRGGFGAMVLGGVVAAALGFGAAQVVDLPFLSQTAEVDPFEEETRAALGDQSAQLEALSGRLDAADAQIAGIDLAPLSDAVDTAAADLAALRETAAGLETRLGDIDARLTALEKAPVVDAVSPEAIAAYERELEALRQEITTQRSEIEAMTQEALAAQGDAERQAELARARSALASLTAAVQSGDPFADQLAVLQENAVAIPDALSAAAADGVPPLAALVEAYPDAARAALAASRTTVGESNLGDFLKGALGARSVTPREGNSPDAVLSRAEAALRSGDTAGALAELQALPDAGRAAMSDWIAMAQLRADAVGATADLAQQLNEE